MLINAVVLQYSDGSTTDVNGVLDENSVLGGLDESTEVIDAVVQGGTVLEELGIGADDDDNGGVTVLEENDESTGTVVVMEESMDGPGETVIVDELTEFVGSTLSTVVVDGIVLLELDASTEELLDELESGPVAMMDGITSSGMLGPADDEVVPQGVVLTVELTDTVLITVVDVDAGVSVIAGPAVVVMKMVVVTVKGVVGSVTTTEMEGLGSVEGGGRSVTTEVLTSSPPTGGPAVLLLTVVLLAQGAVLDELAISSLL